jgi:hypothetical protein
MHSSIHEVHWHQAGSYNIDSYKKKTARLRYLGLRSLLRHIGINCANMANERAFALRERVVGDWGERPEKKKKKVFVTSQATTDTGILIKPVAFRKFWVKKK